MSRKPNLGVLHDHMIGHRALSLSQITSPGFGYFNDIMLFIYYFNDLPNVVNIVEVDGKKANEWFEKNYGDEISKKHFVSQLSKKNRPTEMVEIFYVLSEDLIVNIDYTSDHIKLLFLNTPMDKVESIMISFKKFSIRRKRWKPEITLLTQGQNGMSTQTLEITKPKLSIDDNYNDDFKEIHQTITKRLSKKNDKGLVLLHGKPGTGKTSYIRYLVNAVKKEVIFLPPNMANAISNPDLVWLLLDYPNSIFVIEDAENIVMDREKNGNSAVSALLNLSDGLLSDCLNIQIICTFNTDLSRVDEALLRKGRLIAKYEFKELEVDKARELSEKLGFQTNINEPMALAAIYNQAERTYHEPKNSNGIGFRSMSENRLVEN